MGAKPGNDTLTEMEKGLVTAWGWWGRAGRVFKGQEEEGTLVMEQSCILIAALVTSVYT